jgi:hypothetical protein
MPELNKAIDKHREIFLLTVAKKQGLLNKKKPSKSFSLSSPALPGSDIMGISQLTVKHPLEKDLIN